MCSTLWVRSRGGALREKGGSRDGRGRRRRARRRGAAERRRRRRRKSERERDEGRCVEGTVSTAREIRAGALSRPDALRVERGRDRAMKSWRSRRRSAADVFARRVRETLGAVRARGVRARGRARSVGKR